jgi:hypothetical protein
MLARILQGLKSSTTTTAQTGPTSDDMTVFLDTVLTMVKDTSNMGGNGAYGYTGYLVIRKLLMIYEELLKFTISAFTDNFFAQQSFSGYDEIVRQKEASMYAAVIELNAASRFMKRSYVAAPMDNKFEISINKSLPKAVTMGIVDGQVVKNYSASIATIDFTKQVDSFSYTDHTFAANMYGETLTQNFMFFGDYLNPSVFMHPFHTAPKFSRG